MTDKNLSPLNRRQFLKELGLTSAALLLAGCKPQALPTATGTPIPSPTDLPPTATSTATPSPTLTPTPVPTATPVYKAQAAIGQVTGYDPVALRTALQSMLEATSGLEKLVQPGARVGIKVNLTGGTWWDTPDKPPATEYFVTHPALVGALGELLKDAGASKLFVMDGLGDENSYKFWGYEDMAKPLDAKLIDLCKPAPYAGYAAFPVGDTARVFHTFALNGILNELDVFISVAKLKCHSTTGVTLSMKNLFGLAPISEYRRNAADNNRSLFHGSSDFDDRLTDIILDLNFARPIDLALIDGIMTAEGGAGPWDNISQVKPGVLVLSRDRVAADAAATAIMGFDPQADWPVSPFVHSPNHIALAAKAGLGTNNLEEIQLFGPSIADVRYPFRTAV